MIDVDNQWEYGVRLEWHLLKPKIIVIPASEPGSRVAERSQISGSRVKPGMTVLLVYSGFGLK